MAVGQLKGMSMRTLLDGFLDGCRNMTVGAIILGLAVTLGQVSKDLNTADFFITTLAGRLPAWMLPLGLTVSCMVIAFSIGSSFGTYAVIFPIAVPLAFSLAIAREGLANVPVAGLAAAHPQQWAAILFYVKVCFGAVIGGSIFGDQCSPISDTTVLSSMFTGCDLMDHVRTQLPLALAVAASARASHAACARILRVFVSKFVEFYKFAHALAAHRYSRPGRRELFHVSARSVRP